MTTKIYLPVDTTYDQIFTNTVQLVKSDKNYGSRVFLLTKIKPEYSDILYNPWSLGVSD